MTDHERAASPALGGRPLLFSKRTALDGETRASELETLTSRLIDRSLRPLFPSKFQKETVVTVTVYSADEESELSTLSLLAASAALMVSDIPFNGPMLGGTIISSGGRTMFSVRQSNQTANEFMRRPFRDILQGQKRIEPLSLKVRFGQPVTIWL